MNEQDQELEVEVIEAGSPEALELEADETGELPDEELIPELEGLEVLEGIPPEAVSFDLWRRHWRTRKYGFLDNMALDDFSLELLADRFGGGDYQLRGKQSDGKLLRGATRTFTIAGRPKLVREEPVAERGEPDQLATLTELMRDIATELRARDGNHGAAGENSLTMALQMVTAMQASSQAAVDQALAARGDSPGLDPLELMERMMDLQERFGGGGGGGGTDDVVRSLGRELIGVFRNARAGGETGGPSAPGGPPTGAPPPPGAPAPPDPGRPAWANLMGPYLPQLMALAATGKDPSVYAIVILDQLPDQAADMLAFVVSGPTFAETFYLHFPEALAHREWFDALIAELRADLTGEADDTDDTEHPTEAAGAPETEAGSGASEPDAARSGAPGE